MNKTWARCHGSLTQFKMQRTRFWGLKHMAGSSWDYPLNMWGFLPEWTRFLLRHAVRQPPSLTAFINNRVGSPSALSNSFPPPPMP